MNVYVMVLSFICATRIYWQPFSNHLEAYLNREIALGILAMIGLRQYTDQYGVSNLLLVETGMVIFLPPFLHIIRWIRGNYHKHKDAISGIVSSKIGSIGSRSEKSQTQSLNFSLHSMGTGGAATSSTSRQRIVIGGKGSIEKLQATSRSTMRTASFSKKSINQDQEDNFSPNCGSPNKSPCTMKKEEFDETKPLNTTPAP
ncbi:hypothetical protein BCR33DRAFT_413362 [Rhizoclosmatium globosum]|uniref:Uncharacterized protein n=1 Tax=Rhizoclosmatium globosum TaxID=329046 RepID=A0A1Y2BXA3_9FUNG|nr:hypothetical protein BCR33DRAFT_413362 [Rhizoclosmatium globosum]|eukprot:ORY39400.1 hypothetical protein BCR33DRAFT_413362 [Rhizoclosmatium globosum]